MKVIIFHGTDCKPEDKHYWYAWLKQELEKQGHTVELPYYPDINHTPIEQFTVQVLKNHTFSEDTVIIGHSAGGPLILSILEKIEVPVSRAILVAGYSYRLEGQTKDPVLKDSYNWSKIKSNSSSFVFMNSINDPWGCDDKQGRHLFDKLDGTLIIRNDGHFGSEGNKQIYAEFPLLLNLVGVDL